MLLLAVLLVSFLAGCGSKETTLTGADRDAVLGYSEAITDNLLAGMNANDYAMFSRDFDQDMLNAMTQPQFDSLKKTQGHQAGSLRFA